MERRNIEEKKKSLPEGFPECYENDALKQTVQGVLLALRNKRNVIISGDNESGLTQVAEWCSFYFNAQNKKKKEQEKENKSYVCFCSKNLECSDLIGRTKIKDEEISKKDGPISFEEGFLCKSIKQGQCIVLDSIEEAPSRVIERLNGLLDKKIAKKRQNLMSQKILKNLKKKYIKILELSAHLIRRKLIKYPLLLLIDLK